MSAYTVGQAARLAHVSVRTLHHYDDLGLLRPSARSAAGYRLYSGADLHRLGQIRLYRELEFSLEEIAAILADPECGADDHLRRQHRLVRERQARNAALLAAIEKEMEARRMGMSLTPEEQFEIFGTTQLDEHRAEAEERWGETDAWKESARRTARYTKADWVEIKAEADASIAGFAAALEAGEPADGPTAMDLAEEHRVHLGRWFFDAPHAMHCGIADLYVSDPRFTETYDRISPGLAAYVHAAIHANAERASPAQA